MANDFAQIEWDETLTDDCRQIVRLAVREDLGRGCDLTTVALVPADARGSAAVVARAAGIVAGLRAAEVVIDEMNAEVELSPVVHDGRAVDDGMAVEAGTTIAKVHGSARDLLTAERLLLNFLGRLSGIATLTRRFADAVAGHKARIYDTRKTTPGWRRLEKYAVRCGGGRSHRTGLYDAVLIKDNHLLFADSAGVSQERATPTGGSAAAATRRARAFLIEHLGAQRAARTIVEVEVDTLAQLDDVLKERPDVVLLDNMSLDDLRRAVCRRDSADRLVELEASGGITLENVADVAATGIERISVGALTHAAASLDVGMDWRG